MYVYIYIINTADPVFKSLILPIMTPVRFFWTIERLIYPILNTCCTFMYNMACFLNLSTQSALLHFKLPLRKKSIFFMYVQHGFFSQSITSIHAFTLLTATTETT